jgi:hypothetical protein
MINIDDLTLGQVKQLQSMLGISAPTTSPPDALVGKKVMVRATAGVFFGVLVSRRGEECDLTGARHIYSWNTDDLPRKALNVADLAIIGAGASTRISGAVEGLSTVLGVRAIYECSAESAGRFEALPCRP